MKKFPLKRTLLCILAVLLLVSAGILAWCMFDYYPADEAAMAVLELPGTFREERRIVLTPEEPGDVGLIFYPGAKVKAEAYLPLLDRLRQGGVTVVLAEMPFQMVFFDLNAADRAMAAHPEIPHWYIGGHSMGGAFASDYAAKHPESVEGAILLAANLYGGYDAEKALVIYGALDSLAEKITGDAVHVLAIPGGNHAQFGNYGPQLADPIATIPAETQQQLAADAILEFIFS